LGREEGFKQRAGDAGLREARFEAERTVCVNLFYEPGLSAGVSSLDEDEARHAKVLRLTTSDNILITDGKGLICEAVITTGSQFSILKKTTTSRSCSINLFVAPTKNSDRIEWLVEKATEIGIASITLVRCERSERKNINHDRLLKLAVSAMKQSQQSWLPEIKELSSFADIIKLKFDQNFIAFVDHSNRDQLKNLAQAGKSYGLLIGPEGDFTENEIALAQKHSWQKVSLGSTRLRTETAALVGSLTLVLVNS
jgi:16S rRNA (uracil1498-N3)-methyltransferase